MLDHELYRDIAERTQGDVYVGVVGPVRAGKSTFIRRFMEKLVIPGIENAYERTRAIDELPQGGSGRTIMTTQPVFVPNEAAAIELSDGKTVSMRLIDSVGYLVEGALGTQDGESMRMVQTPWFSEPIAFDRAAEIGTKKIISDHSTIGIVVTTDGTVTDFPRESYEAAEARVIKELKALDKPFVVLLNTDNPSSSAAQNLSESLSRRYDVPVIAINASQIEESDIRNILRIVLSQFPVLQMNLQTPEWVGALAQDNWLIERLSATLTEKIPDTLKIGDVQSLISQFLNNEHIDSIEEKRSDLGNGVVDMHVTMKEGLFNQILAEECGTEIKNDAHLLTLLCELVHAKREYDHIAKALDAVRETGYGLVAPNIEEMTMQEPEIMKHGGQFGVKLRASAPSLHLIRVDIQTEISPVVGTEQQSEEMIRYLMKGFEEDPKMLWQSNLFGKPLAELVREGLSNKLMHMPEDTQLKMQQTLQKIINEGTGGVLCILL